MSKSTHASTAVLLVPPSDLESENQLDEVKFTKDHRIILIPQPSDSPDDPLNWTSFKKHAILLCAAFSGFAADFMVSESVACIILQAEEWKISSDGANYPNNLALIMLGVSSLLWMPLLNSWGRIPVLFWSTVLGLLFTLGCALTPGISTYYPLRVLQALSQGTGATAGLAFIDDLFFFHERARKIGVWYTIFLCSPFVSPLLGYFMVSGLQEWRPVYWVVFAVYSLVLASIVVFGDETYWNRRSFEPAARQEQQEQQQQQQQPIRKPGWRSRLSRVVGLWQLEIHHHQDRHLGYFYSVLGSYGRLFGVLISKPLIPITLITYSVIFMWGIGINQTSALLLETSISEGGYGMSSRAIGFMYFTPIVAVFLGEAIGHKLNDAIASLYVNRHRGLFTPEARLWTAYLGAALMVPGLILVGYTLQRHLHWVGIVFGWGMYQCGTMLVSVAVVAYLLDCYPNASVEISTWANFGRCLTGFSIGYFQQAWGRRDGYAVSFGVQAAIVGAAFGVIWGIQIFGARVR
ncbi:major facilitator superfamily domain-containing protein [Penicillium macrosclerotiorum]|uniref:major facilitator superfamily domain-containing protein n=1 Tax=Penicillium macrosclerotiorum TaxID=303699 RepID=UPI002546ED38|nr:major facilitator superfamily domain-containing protein [Penicillium macrosclerotiorum]KAJ5673957.1 major facilitator superfamily domain-containing protein [Penicillium macrosclerotiorum]